MIAAEPRSVDHLLQVAAETQALFERLRVFSETALDAVTRDRPEALHRILQSRDATTREIDPRVRFLSTERAAAKSGSPTDRSRIDDAVARVEAAARTVQTLDARLESQVAERRARIAHEIQRMDHADAALAAYGASESPSPAGLDRLG